MICLAALWGSACADSADDAGPQDATTDRAGAGNEFEAADADDEGELENDGIARSGCDPATIGEDDGPVLVIYEVEGAELGDVCFGEDQSIVADAWADLAQITPASELDSVDIVAGFRSDGDSATVAFAGPIDETDNSRFLIALDVDEAERDLAELRVTLAHEFSHVVTQRPDQLDITVSSFDCTTFFNGYGCFGPDAYMQQWVDRFWTEDDLAGLPATGEPDEDAGADRCAIDPTFLGGYAASHPEEDFAESFAAFVLGVDINIELEPKMAFFEQFPEFVIFRDRATNAGFAGVENTFEPCG